MGGHRAHRDGRDVFANSRADRGGNSIQYHCGGDVPAARVRRLVQEDAGTGKSLLSIFELPATTLQQ